MIVFVIWIEWSGSIRLNELQRENPESEETIWEILAEIYEDNMEKLVKDKSVVMEVSSSVL